VPCSSPSALRSVEDSGVYNIKYNFWHVPKSHKHFHSQAFKFTLAPRYVWKYAERGLQMAISHGEMSSRALFHYDPNPSHKSPTSLAAIFIQTTLWVRLQYKHWSDSEEVEEKEGHPAFPACIYTRPHWCTQYRCPEKNASRAVRAFMPSELSSMQSFEVQSCCHIAI